MRPKRIKKDLSREPTKVTNLPKQEKHHHPIKSAKSDRVRKTYRNCKSDKIQLKSECVKKDLKENVDKKVLVNLDNVLENKGFPNESDQNENIQRPQCSHCSRYFKSTAGLRRHEVSCNPTLKVTTISTKRSRTTKNKAELSKKVLQCEKALQTPTEELKNVDSSEKHSSGEVLINETSTSAVENNVTKNVSVAVGDNLSNQISINTPIFFVDKPSEDELSVTTDSLYQPSTDPLSINNGLDAPSDHSEVIDEVVVKDENKNDENIMVQQLQCTYCSKICKTLQGAKRHEKVCKNKPPLSSVDKSSALEDLAKEVRTSRSEEKSTEYNERPLTVNGKQSNDDEDEDYSSESSFENKCECCGEDKETAHIVGDFECHECKKLFRLKSSVERHIRVVHNGEGHDCPQCGAKCPDKGTLARHMYTHTGLKPYSCPVCKQEFSRKYHIVRHNMQTGCDGKERPVFPCQVCGREFNRKDNLREHLRAHAGQTKRKKKYTCDSCGLIYEAPELLKMHKKTHFIAKQYSCDFCPKTFSLSGAMKKHRRTHTGEKPYECTTCHRKFAAKETLNRHVRLHTGYKPYTCQYCGKSFIQSTQLKSHIYYHTGQSVLQNTEVFVCDLCGKKFNRKARLNEHVKFVHLGAKPFECEQCGKTFIRKEDLNRHRIIHSGIKAHQCPICSKAFAMKSTLKVHLLTHTKEPPRSCDECGRAFIRQDCLLRHMRNKHKEMLEEIKSEAEKKKLQQQLLQVAAEASLVEGMEGREELDENGLVDAVRELLTLLVDETTLKGLGWPAAGVEALLEAVIKRCGHEPAPSSTPRHDRLRHNIKLLFTVVIDDSAVKALLNNQTVDEVILHVLRLAKS